MTVPAAAVALAKRFEGLRLAPYHDPAGFPTIGYGTLLSREQWADLARWPAIDEAEAERLLLVEMERAAGAVGRLITAPLLAPARAALVDFCYNLGAGALQASTLRARVNRGDPGAVNEFGRWVYAGGRRLPGLVLRRQAEADLFASPPFGRSE